MEYLFTIFLKVAKKYEKNQIISIFEIYGYKDTKPEETKGWLEYLGYKKTQDMNPEKYIKFFEVK